MKVEPRNRRCNAPEEQAESVYSGCQRLEAKIFFLTGVERLLETHAAITVACLASCGAFFLSENFPLFLFQLKDCVELFELSLPQTIPMSQIFVQNPVFLEMICFLGGACAQSALTCIDLRQSRIHFLGEFC
jgi:hypothetical protein